MKRRDLRQCIFAQRTRQAMTFTNLCGGRCSDFGLIDMISVIFWRVFLACAVARRTWPCELAKSCDDESRAIMEVDHGERGAGLMRSIATASRRICDARANVRDDDIVRLFCPTGQRIHPRLKRRIHWALKSLISLAPATVHGVVFEVFDSGTPERCRGSASQRLSALPEAHPEGAPVLAADHDR
jgi:hypothetical protein